MKLGIERCCRAVCSGAGQGGRDHNSFGRDLLVVEREVADRYAEMLRLDEALSGLILPVDLLVIAEQDFCEWAETPGSIYRTASREGKVLYEAINRDSDYL